MVVGRRKKPSYIYYLTVSSFASIYDSSPSELAQAATLVARILQVLSSNLGRDTDCSNRLFVGFPHSRQTYNGLVDPFQIGHHFLTRPFLLTFIKPSYHLTLLSEVLTVSLNKQLKLSPFRFCASTLCTQHNYNSVTRDLY
jgi:hypothetical protein